MATDARQRIVSATATLIERQGYAATGLKEILEVSQTPRGSLYHYFPDGKESLAAEAIAQRMGEMADHSRRILAEIDDPAEAVHAMIRQFAEAIAAQGCGTGAPIAAVALEASNSSERLRKACAAGYEGLRAVLAAKLVMSGFSAETATKLAKIINASIEGGMVMSRTNHDVSVLFDVADAMKILIENMSQT